MVNTGYLDEAVPVVRGFVDAFAGYDAIIAPSGSCVGSVRHQHAMVARRSGDAALVDGAARTSAVVHELSEFLVDVLGVEDVGAYFPHKVTYHPTCHSLRMLGVGDRPTRLLQAVRGLRLVELPAADQCCGFGGTFAVKNPDTSVAMGADKARHVRDTGAEVLVAGDSSCLMHVGGVLSRQRAGVRVMHLAEVLAATESTEVSRLPQSSDTTDSTDTTDTTDGRTAVTGAGAGMTATFVGMPPFPEAARAALGNTQLRQNLAHATGTIRNKRAAVVAEVDDWEELRLAGAEIKDRTLRHLDEHLLQLEASLQSRGVTVHWARDAQEACAVVAGIAKGHGVDEVVKVKSMATHNLYAPNVKNVNIFNAFRSISDN